MKDRINTPPKLTSQPSDKSQSSTTHSRNASQHITNIKALLGNSSGGNPLQIQSSAGLNSGVNFSPEGDKDELDESPNGL
jgi:hypothetical protein